MGLSTSVIHLRNVEQQNGIDALDRCLRGFGFTRSECLPVPQSGPEGLPGHDQWRGPYYLVCHRHGEWVTIIEVHPDSEGRPYAYDLSNKLSEKLDTYALLFVVHDSDVFIYNLDHKGVALDGYNSCPIYFTQEPMTELEIEEQRHTPHHLAVLSPEGVPIARIEEVLNDGFWAAFDAGKRGDELVAASADRTYLEEADRMREVGRLLQLNGKEGGYPYAAWADSAGVSWAGSQVVRYERRKGLDRLLAKLSC